MISVVIAAFNGGPYLADAVDSALRQTLPPHEVIVVDDGSTDDTPEVARAFGDAIRYVRHERAGMGASRNRGVELSSGSYLSFLDADDRFTPTKLERQMAAFDADPSLDIVFGHVTEFVSPELSREQARTIRPARHDVPWSTPNLMLIKRPSFDKVGGFSTELRVAIGVDWYARAREAGLRMHTPAEIVLERRLHLDNNGIREAASRKQYIHVLKASLDRRRGFAGEAPEH